MKAAHHEPYEKLEPIPPQKRPWESIALDFITKLPKSKEPGTATEYDSITINERLTKYACFIPVKESITAEETAYTVLRYVIANYRLLNKIISDRDTRFMDKFWQTLMERLGVKHKASTAYHP